MKTVIEDSSLKGPSGRRAGQMVQRFYQGNHLAVELQGEGICRLTWARDVPVLQRDNSHAHLLQADLAGTVLGLQRMTLQEMAYSPYGHRLASQAKSLLGFNGQRIDPLAQGYHLGNGHRVYSPARMRFNSSDALSPFGKGGINAYGYCGGDPVNKVDPTGQMLKSLKKIFIRKNNPSTEPTVTTNPAQGVERMPPADVSQSSVSTNRARANNYTEVGPGVSGREGSYVSPPAAAPTVRSRQEFIAKGLSPGVAEYYKKSGLSLHESTANYGYLPDDFVIRNFDELRRKGQGTFIIREHEGRDYKFSLSRNGLRIRSGTDS